MVSEAYPGTFLILLPSLLNVILVPFLYYIS